MPIFKQPRFTLRQSREYTEKRMRAYSSPFQIPPNKDPKPLSARPRITGLWPVFQHVRVIFSKSSRVSHDHW